DRTVRALGEPDREESRTALVHVDPGTDTGLFPESEGKRSGARPRRDADVLDATAGQLLDERRRQCRVAVGGIHGWHHFGFPRPQGAEGPETRSAVPNAWRRSRR